MGWAARSNVASVLVLRTKKFKMIWLSRGQSGERKGADQTILQRFITILLMKEVFEQNGIF